VVHLFCTPLVQEAQGRRSIAYSENFGRRFLLFLSKTGTHKRVQCSQNPKGTSYHTSKQLHFTISPPKVLQHALCICRERLVTPSRNGFQPRQRAIPPVYALIHCYRAFLSQSGHDSKRTYVVYVGRCTCLCALRGVHVHVPLMRCAVGPASWRSRTTADRQWTIAFIHPPMSEECSALDICSQLQHIITLADNDFTSAYSGRVVYRRPRLLQPHVHLSSTSALPIQ
jgi:hypothetical protein